MSEASAATKSHLHISELIELAYSLAREQFGSQFFSFSNIGSKVGKNAEGFSKEKVENGIGYFYTELLNDPRFVVFSFNKLRLKEYMDFNEVKKLEKTVFSDDSVFEEEYESYLAEKEKKEVEVVMENSSEDDIPEDDLDDEKDVDSEEEEGDEKESVEGMAEDSFEEDL